MEPPVAFDGTEVRNRKVDVLNAVRRIAPDRVAEHAVRGQYASGWVEGERVSAYRDEPDVAEDSLTETFAALKLNIDNWRWQGVPFYLRTGKRLQAKVSEVVIQFRPVPHHTFPQAALMGSQPNRLLLSIQPHEGIFLRFEVKHPGLSMQLSPVLMQFYYQEAFEESSPEAYETLLLDVMQGDTMLFMRADQTEAAWKVLAPVLKAWDESKPFSFPDYQAGSWGPEDADRLIARDGRNWILPTYLQCKEKVTACRVATGEDT
jgi:glucose-6-phosphate 1-dehydrogenase